MLAIELNDVYVRALSPTYTSMDPLGSVLFLFPIYQCKSQGSHSHLVSIIISAQWHLLK